MVAVEGGIAVLFEWGSKFDVKPKHNRYQGILFKTISFEDLQLPNSNLSQGNNSKTSCEN